jgi:Flp pilus assembly protein TadB
MTAVLALAALIVVCVALGPRRAPRPLASTAPTAPPRPSSSRRARRRLDDAVPDLIDLLVLAIRGGALPAEALRESVDLCPPVLHPHLQAVVDRIDAGERFADALATLPATAGPGVLALTDTLVSADRYGLPLGPVLTRLADDARATRRRRLEARTRELPVRLAAPLVLCQLPSFVLLAVVPLLVGALSSLQL